MVLELVERDLDVRFRIRWMKEIVIRFLLTCKREIIFKIIFWIEGTRNQVPSP